MTAISATEWFLLNKEYHTTWSCFVGSKSILLFSFTDHYKLILYLKKKKTLILQRRWCVLGFVSGRQLIPQFLVNVCFSIVVCGLWFVNDLITLSFWPLSPCGDAQSLRNDHLPLWKIHFYNKVNLTKFMINFWKLAAQFNEICLNYKVTTYDDYDVPPQSCYLYNLC